MMGISKTAVEEPPQVGAGSEEPEPIPAALVAKRRRLELAKVDVVHQLALARVEAHREMLRRALEALEEELRRLA